LQGVVECVGEQGPVLVAGEGAIVRLLIARQSAEDEPDARCHAKPRELAQGIDCGSIEPMNAGKVDDQEAQFVLARQFVMDALDQRIGSAEEQEAAEFKHRGLVAHLHEVVDLGVAALDKRAPAGERRAQPHHVDAGEGDDEHCRCRQDADPQRLEEAHGGGHREDQQDNRIVGERELPAPDPEPGDQQVDAEI